MKDYIKLFYFFLLAAFFFIAVNFSCNKYHMDHIDLDGGIAFTFDDNYVDDWFSLRDLFLEYQVKATFFVSNFDSLQEREIVLLDTLQSDGHEIGCHGYRHKSVELDYNGDPGRIDEYLQTEILPAIEVMNENGFHPVSFAYPFGHRNSYYDRALLKYFSHVRSTVYPDNSRSAKYTNEAFYSCSRDSGLVYALGIDSVYEIKRKHLKAALRRAMEDGKILILYAHRVGHQTNKYSVSIDDIKALIEIASELQLRFYTLSQMEHQCFAL